MSDGSQAGPRGIGVMFWVVLSIVVVGLAVMIALPLAGR